MDRTARDPGQVVAVDVVLGQFRQALARSAKCSFAEGDLGAWLENNARGDGEDSLRSVNEQEVRGGLSAPGDRERRGSDQSQQTI